MAFKIGDRIKLTTGKEVIIEAFPQRSGKSEIYFEGGQGLVYKVSLDGMPYALKWYKRSFIKNLGENLDKFKNNLTVNVENGPPNAPKSPDSSEALLDASYFIWPKFLTQEINGSFGYVMDLKPDNYVDFDDVYSLRYNFSSVSALINCALNMVSAFQTLHKEGYVYLDLNDGNFFINPVNGDIKICDNDNVAANPPFNIGKPGYIAPELVRGDNGVMSSRRTDYHSLAVVLFKLFIRHDPLEGIRFIKVGALSPKIQLEFYGTNPIFIFDEQGQPSKENPPATIQKNPLNLWPMLPPYIQKAFIQTFCKGLVDPTERIMDSDWKKRLLKFKDEILKCMCGKETYIHLHKTSGNPTVNCPCGKQYNFPLMLHIDKSPVYMFPGNLLMKCHLNNDTNTTVIGKVVVSKNDVNRWGLQNLTDDAWIVIKNTGEKEAISNGKIVVLKENTTIEFVPGTTGILK